MPLRKLMYLLLGGLGLALGALGAVLPVLPSVPFLLLAAYGFGRSSQRLDRWFQGTRLYRENLADLAAGRGMTRRAKIRIMVTVTLFMAAPSWPWTPSPWAASCWPLSGWGHVFYFLFGVRTLPDDEEKTDK